MLLSLFKAHLVGSVLFILFILFKNTHSVGTHLLHAGPTCFVTPNSNNSLLSTKSPIKHRGVCYSTLLCKQKGGVAIGKCGLGNSCCVFPQSCDSVLIRNSTYFTNPHYPQWTTIESGQVPQEYSYGEKESNYHCSLTIHRMPGIYQICKFKLDFIEYTNKHDIKSENDIENNQIFPSSSSKSSQKEGRCEDGQDRLVLRGMHHRDHTEQEVFPPICLSGNRRSQVTIDVSSHIGPFELSIEHSNPSPNQIIKRRVRWNILITQVECPNASVTHGSHASRLATLLNRQSP